MALGLNMDSFPRYCQSAYKTFLPGEIHITRICPEDVLILMLEGTVHFYEDGTPISLSRGEYYIQRSGLRQEGRIPSSDAHYYYIHFHGDFRSSGSVLPLRGTIDTAALLPLCAQLESLALLPRPMLEKNAVFYRILALLNRNQADTGHRRTVEKIISVISRDLGEAYSLDTLSKICGYSKNHIINVFKAETGTTPYAYIQKLRLDRAKHLLAYSDIPTGEIAASCGFGNYVNFYKEFQKKEGCSPTQWRSNKNAL